MSNSKNYTYLSLENATLNLRKFKREITPPNMAEVKNFIPSRSDAAVTLRPDWIGTSENIEGFSAKVTFPSTFSVNDALFAASGLFGSNQLVYFTPFIPYGIREGYMQVLSGYHSDGLVSCESDSSLFTGHGTAFQRKAYRGALMRVRNVGTPYSGSPYKFTVSPADSDEYYLVEQDGTAVNPAGIYLAGLSGDTFKKYDSPGGMAYNYSAGIGDNDGLGSNHLYVRLEGASGSKIDPADETGDGSSWRTLYMQSNISGSLNYLKSSGSGTNEYYLVKRADDSAPVFVPTAPAALPETPAENRITGRDFLYTAWADGQDLVSGQSLASYPTGDKITPSYPGVLANGQWGVGNTDTLGFNTIYVRSNTGNPDTVGRKGTYDGGVLEAAYYLQIAHGVGNYAWNLSGISSADGKTRPVYYLTKSSASPQISRAPLYFKTNGTYPTERRDVPDDLGSGNSVYGGWSYGDSVYDNLGYNTLYYMPGDGELALSSTTKVNISGIQPIVLSNYSWVASAGGTNEYYLAAQNGTKIGSAFDEPLSLRINNVPAKKNAVSSLADGEWGYGAHGGDSLPANTIYIRWDKGDPDAQFLPVYANYSYRLYASDYKWTESGTSNEWYLSLTAGTDPSVSSPTIVTVDDYQFSEGTVGSLTYQEWDYGDNDTLGFSTIYIYSTSDPNGDAGTGLGDETKPKNVVVRSAALDYNWYVVDSVASDTELRIVGNPAAAVSDCPVTFYYNHNVMRNIYKPNVQGYTSGIIYGLPEFGESIINSDISGPFYAGVQEGDWKYEPRIEIDSSINNVDDIDLSVQPTFATSGNTYIQLFPTFAENSVFADFDRSSYITLADVMRGDGSWVRWDSTSGATGAGSNILTINGSQQTGQGFAFTGVQEYGGVYLASGVWLPVGAGGAEPGCLYSTNSAATTWATIEDEDYDWAAASTYANTDYICISAAANGSALGRVCYLLWRKSDDNIIARYTDNQGDWVNDINVGGTGNPDITDGSKYSKIKYLGGIFVVTVADGIYYGDGTALTKVAITGADNIQDIDYDGSSLWAALESPDATVWYSYDHTTTSWSESTIPKIDATEETSFIHYDPIGERWLISTPTVAMWTDTFDVDPSRGNEFGQVVDGGEVPWAWSVLNTDNVSLSTQNPGNLFSNHEGVWFALFSDEPLTHVVMERFNQFWWDIDKFVPLSDDYRSNTFSVLDGYVVLINVSEREWEEIFNPKTYTVTTTPAVDGTENDFTFKLAPTGDHGIRPDQVVLKCTVSDGTDDTTEVITDDGGNGILQGNVSATGTINYDTGDCHLIFNTKTIKNGTTMTADFEYITEGETIGWVNHPRRIRWTAPKTYNDFSGYGSGTGDAEGEDAFMDSRPVNGRIVVFETNGISTIVPRGIVEDPFDFDTVQRGVVLHSNPVVVQDWCYFIASDGLLWRTNAFVAQEAGAPYDATRFDDFSEKNPIYLTHSRLLNTLFAYYFDKNDSTPTCHAISLATGTVSEIELPVQSDSGGRSEQPRYVVTVDDSSDRRVLVAHHPLSGDTDKCVISSLTTNRGITGIDKPASGQTDYWYGFLETGELFIDREGMKSSILSLILKTYTGANQGNNTYRPYVACEVKSIEDSSWYSMGDSVGTATMTTSALTGSGTAWSNTIATGDDATQTFTLPCLASQARVYIDSTLQTSGTDYTASGKNITLTSVLASGTTLYAYWENYPEVKVAVGDVFKSTEGFHIVRTINTATSITCDHYLSSGSETVTHYPTTQMPDGQGETKLGIWKLVEGAQVRLYVIPQYDKTEVPSIVKISGITICFVRHGRKILEATGS